MVIPGSETLSELMQEPAIFQPQRAFVGLKGVFLSICGSVISANIFAHFFPYFRLNRHHEISTISNSVFVDQSIFFLD